MVKHVCFYLALIILLLSFGCKKKEESSSASNPGPSAADVDSTLGAGYKVVESEGRDDATGLWKEIVHKKSGIHLRLIPAGEFEMGESMSAEDTRKKYGGNVEWYRLEHPQHHVTISKPFYIGKYEVTQAQWKTIMGDNPSSFKGDDNLPVENVTWNDTQDFCRKAGDGLRLPSEAEWEYACRAGKSGKQWCFGDDENALGDYAWYDENSGDKTHPVGDREPNDFGLYDMHGNVWEWCEDVWHGNYNDAPDDGSAWTTGGDEESSRVNRGGSWIDIAGGTRSAGRAGDIPDFRFWFNGFRVVVSPKAIP
jgi:formylglycine-generating enzyme required for sulfatase activity